MKIKLIVEDSWGVLFFPIVIERLKAANLVNRNLIIQKPKHSPANCNGKLDEILKMVDAPLPKRRPPKRRFLFI
jgi:hypothetical protein